MIIAFLSLGRSSIETLPLIIIEPLPVEYALLAPD